MFEIHNIQVWQPFFLLAYRSLLVQWSALPRCPNQPRSHTIVHAHPIQVGSDYGSAYFAHVAGIYSRHSPVVVNLTISVDLSGILPEGLRDPRTRTMVVNLEQIYILTITSTTQLETLKVDFVKKAIQVLCWECFQIGILKRNFKMWLQTSPSNTPGLPYGRFCTVDYDMTWKEVLDLHQIPHEQRHIHLRAHHSESTQE